MDNTMDVSKTILEELKKYNKINNYILEQEAGELPPPPAEEPAPLPTDVPPAEGATPPVDVAAEPQPVDVENDPDVEKLDDSGEAKPEGGDSDELEITDLVDAQKNIEQKQEEYFNNLFTQLTNLESKLQDMDSVFEKLNQIENKIEKYRVKTPEEKLELRSLDSGPFNQKLSDFFSDKEEDLEKSGKNEYVLTTDDVEDYSKDEIKNSFSSHIEDEKNYIPIKN
jgi:hypothetical protein